MLIGFMVLAGCGQRSTGSGHSPTEGKRPALPNISDQIRLGDAYPLQGITAVNLKVRCMMTDMTDPRYRQDSAGYRRDFETLLTTRAELRLRQTGLNVVSGVQATAPELIIVVDGGIRWQSNLEELTVEARVHELVAIDRNQLVISADTWDFAGWQQLHRSGAKAEHVSTVLDEQFNMALDKFCNDWLKANPK